LAEAGGLKPPECGFESHRGHSPDPTLTGVPTICSRSDDLLPFGWEQIVEAGADPSRWV
jgi:hypothetical protein